VEGQRTVPLVWLKCFCRVQQVNVKILWVMHSSVNPGLKVQYIEFCLT